MLEQMKRISFRISSVLSKVEPKPDLYTGSSSDQKNRLRNTACNTRDIQAITAGPAESKTGGTYFCLQEECTRH